MRRRLAAIIETLGEYERSSLASQITRELGVDVSSNVYGTYTWTKWLKEAVLRDVLDAVTLAAKSRSGNERGRFISEVRAILDSEAVRYRLDDAGGIHPRVDVAFEQQTTSTLAGLGSDRFKAARSEVERSVAALQSASPDGKTAIQAIFEAAEIVYKRVFQTRPRLTRAFVLQDLRPPPSAEYAKNDAITTSAEAAAKAFGEWVESCHVYRHGQGEHEPNQPPISHAVLLVSQGLSYVRWLAGLVA
jgi:hypothetical protein